MSEHDAHQALEHTVWTAVGNMQQGTLSARSQPAYPSRNVRKQPPNPTVERHEIEGGHGGPHQRSPDQGPGRASYPGTIHHHVPNTRKPQRMETISTNGRERRDPIPKSDLHQSETLKVLPPASNMQSPRSNSHQDLDCQQTDCDILSLHSACTDAHARRGISGNDIIDDPRNNIKHPPGKRQGYQHNISRRFQPPAPSVG